MIILRLGTHLEAGFNAAEAEVVDFKSLQQVCTPNVPCVLLWGIDLCHMPIVTQNQQSAPLLHTHTHVNNIHQKNLSTLPLSVQNASRITAALETTAYAFAQSETHANAYMRLWRPLETLYRPWYIHKAYGLVTVPNSEEEYSAVCTLDTGGGERPEHNQ